MGKTLMTTTIAAVLALGMTACDKTSDATKSAGQATSDAAKATGNAVGNAAKATGDAVGNAAKATGEAVGNAAKATSDYLSQSKEESMKSAQETLDGIDKKWQILLVKATPVTDEAKAEFKKVKEQMAQEMADAKAKLVEAKEASADTWQKTIKPALNATLQNAQKLYEESSAKFGK